MSDALEFHRVFAMPSADTLSIKPIKDWALTHLARSRAIIDPFARNSRIGTWRNDLNPETAAEFHMDAADFCVEIGARGIVCDAAIFDPPYSPRQISECYSSIGRDVTMRDTQGAALYRRVRDALDHLLEPGAVVLSFGWSSNGMGVRRGYRVESVLLVQHGGAHNDTICVAERKMPECQAALNLGQT